MKQLLSLFILLFGLISCGDDIIERKSDSIALSEFVDTNIGSTNLYELDSISIYGIGGVLTTQDSAHWFMKDSLVLIDTISLVEFVLYFERSLALEEDGNYNFESKYSLRVTKDELIRNKNSVLKVLLTDPIVNNKEFNAIKYLDAATYFDFKGEQMQLFKNWYQSVANFDLDLQESQDFQILVNYVDEDNLLERRKEEVIYQKNIGLYSSYKEMFDTQCNGNVYACKDTEWLEKADKGFIEKIRWIRKLH